MGRVMGIFLDFAPLGQDFPALRLSSNLTSLLRHSLRSAYAKFAEPTNNALNPTPTLIKKTVTKVTVFFMGRVMGIEPTNTGTTIRGLNRLATPAIFHLFFYNRYNLFYFVIFVLKKSAN